MPRLKKGPSSFLSDLREALRYLHENPSSLDFIRLALLNLQGSRSLTRWNDFTHSLSQWHDTHHRPLVFFFARSTNRIPSLLTTHFAEETRFLSQMKILFQRVVDEAQAALDSPMGLSGVSHDYEDGAVSESPVVFERNDGERLVFLFAEEDLQFLATVSLGMLDLFLKNGGRLSPGYESELRDRFVSIAKQLAPVPDQREVAAVKGRE